MVAVHTTQVRLLSARSLPGGVTLEPIRLDSTRSAMRCVDARVRFYPTFGPDGLFSRGTRSLSAPSEKWPPMQTGKAKKCLV